MTLNSVMTAKPCYPCSSCSFLHRDG